MVEDIMNVVQENAHECEVRETVFSDMEIRIN